MSFVVRFPVGCGIILVVWAIYASGFTGFGCCGSGWGGWLLVSFCAAGLMVTVCGVVV